MSDDKTTAPARGDRLAAHFDTPLAVCPGCGWPRQIKDGHYVAHSRVIDGLWLAAHTEVESGQAPFPQCCASGLPVADGVEVRTKRAWDKMPTDEKPVGETLSWKEGHEVVKNPRWS